MPENQSAFSALAKLDRGELQKLEVRFNNRAIETGRYIGRADAQTTPTIALPNAKGRYLVVALDMDAPFVKVPILGPILHWRQSGYRPATDGTLTHGDTPFVTDYIGPAPPPLSGPHRYCFFLYEEPIGFDVKQYAHPHGIKIAATKRMLYSLDTFEKEAKLGPIVACNYFRSN